ncbi:MAG: M56 family metallopeptidase [Terracidiphilus sp.]
MHLAAMNLMAMIGDLQLVAPAALAWFASAGEAFARTAGTTLVTSIWQGAVIVCGLEICLIGMPRISAAHRFMVRAAGFGVAAGLPLMSLVHIGTSSAPTVADAGSAGAPLLQLDPRWGLAIAGLWVVCSAIRGAALTAHSMRLRRLWKTARPIKLSATLAAALKNVRGGRVTICTTEMLDRPSVIGFLAPRILIPTWLMARLTQAELEQIVLHEAEHLRRFDDWTNLVQKLTLVVYPLNPGLSWMEHKLCGEREMACDEGVVRITNAPRAYAACLASLAERKLERRAESLSLGAWHRRSELVHRVHGILQRKRGLSRAATAALLGAVGCALVASSVEMARCPELVAFVPEQKSVGMTPARHREMAAMLARENAEAKMSLPAGFHAVQARVVMPEAHPAITMNAPRHESAKGTAVAEQTSQKIAKAAGVGDRVNPGAEQQWVVLAAWEEVQTVSRTASMVTDYDANVTANDIGNDAEAKTQKQDQGKSAGQATKKLPNLGISEYKITQLILRVVPANSSSNSTQPAGSVRGGWFVIQL